MAQQTLLDFADADAHTRLESDGFAIGWEHARHGVVPPPAHLANDSPVREGWQAGRAAFARRSLPATPAVRQWLQLRLAAWQHGLAFEAVQVTPHYLKQLAVTHCPITRETLGDAPIERVRRDAGVAAGNLAMLGERVIQARAGRGVLADSEARRLAVLESFVTPLAHEDACALPLLVLPPNRLRLFNPVQALQALLTRLLVGEGFAQRAARVEALVPGDAARRDFRRFVHALLPRVLGVVKSADALALRWALEDAWQDALVTARWLRFARQLTAEQCERIVQRAAARGIAPLRLLETPQPLDTEGWALGSAGRTSGVARAVERPVQPMATPPRQTALPL